MYTQLEIDISQLFFMSIMTSYHMVAKQKKICYWKVYTHPFNAHFSGTTQMSRYQKGKTNLDFTEARDSEWLLASAGTYASLHLAPDR